AATVRHENVAATLAVFETGETAAVVQEWPPGLPSGEWRHFATTPAVWLRLLRQATSALAAIHGEGLLHGRIHSGRLLLTPEGSIKLGGLGEAGWMHGDDALLLRPATASDDLRALAKVAAGWLAGTQKAPPPGTEPLVALLRRYGEPQIRAAVLV